MFQVPACAESCVCLCLVFGSFRGIEHFLSVAILCSLQLLSTSVPWTLIRRPAEAVYATDLSA